MKQKTLLPFKKGERPKKKPLYKRDLQRKKESLIGMIDALGEEYDETSMHSLDRWDGGGFPKAIEVELCGLPLLDFLSEGDDGYVEEGERGYDYDSDYPNVKDASFEKRNRVLRNKYGFEVGLDGNLYYNSDMRSFSGYVLDEDDGGSCLKVRVHTTKNGISPVGSDAENVRNIIRDAEEIDTDFFKENG